MCGSFARTDLYGGRSAMIVPTVTAEMTLREVLPSVLLLPLLRFTLYPGFVRLLVRDALCIARKRRLRLSSQVSKWK